MCFEHDPNRQQTLDADILRSLADLLSVILGVSDDGVKREGGRRELSHEELTFVRAATGAMLNSSLMFDPVRQELTRREYLLPLLAILDSRTAGRVTAPVYTTGSWAIQTDDAKREQRLHIGSMAAGWAANILEDVLGENKTNFPIDFGIPALASVVLSAASFPSSPSLVYVSSDDAADYLDTDIELLTISASLLDGIVQDSDAAKSAIAFSTFDPSLPYPRCTLLHPFLKFIKTARPPSYWTTVSDDPARTEKAFSTIKASIVRAVVEAPNSDEVMERLWKETCGEDGAETSGKNWLIEELVRWLEEAEDGREDMLICSSHMLAGLGRRVANRQVVGETDVISYVSQLLRKELDVVQPLQLATIGLLKHLASGAVSNALAMLNMDPTSADSASSTLYLILSLSSRTDDLRLRSESTRVIANLVRTLFAAPSEVAATEQVKVGREELTSREVVSVLAEMVRTSERYPGLVNEGVVGLTLLAGSGEKGAVLVLEALLASHTQPVAQPSSTDPDLSSAMAALTTTSSTPAASAASSTPSSAASVLSTWLSSAPSSSSPTSTIPPEMLANVASLIFAVLHGTAASEGKEATRRELRGVIDGPLRSAAGVLNQGAVSNTIGRALDVVEREEQS
ncbi:hypothetical protein JCM10295v2_004188 [Rhodotorula toruloides]